MNTTKILPNGHSYHKECIVVVQKEETGCGTGNYNCVINSLQ